MRSHPPRRRPFTAFLLATFALSLAPPATTRAADGAASPLQALREGEAHIGLRYRLETVDDDLFDDRALASTLRTTLAYESAVWRGWSLFTEAENVTAVPDDDLYANAGAGGLSNRVSDRPVVADPEITEMNQAFVRWRSPAVTVTLGRQEIGWGDQRFVGPVGWRQNHQSFDVARVAWRPGGAESPGVELDYAYLVDVHRIFGDDRELEGHLLRAPVAVGAAGTLTPMAVLLDYDDPRFAASSTATFAAELAGSAPVGSGGGENGVELGWELDYAVQRDHGDNPRHDLDLDYAHAAGSARLAAVRLEAAIERLEGDGVSAFQTPLATLHKFDGWADLFLVTPPDGLEAISLAASGDLGPVAWTARVWDFAAENEGRDYGRELDLLASWTSRRGPTLAAKAAIYDEDGFGRDLAKLMVWTAWSFGTGS